MFRHRLLMRTLAGVVSGALIAATSGCMTPPPSLALHEQLLGRHIALRPDPSGVRISLDAFAKSKPQGALKGAGQGIADMLGHLGGGHCSGELCGAALLVVLGVAVVVGGSVGALQGMHNAMAQKTAAAVEASVEERLAGFSSHLDLAQRVRDRGREGAGTDLELVPVPAGGSSEPDPAELQALQEQGFDTLLALTIDKLAFVGERGENPRLQLAIEARARIIDTAHGEQVYRRTFRYLGEKRRFSEWLEGDGDKLVAALDSGLNALVADIVSTLFVAYQLPVPSGTWTFPGTPGYGCCWICPRSPPLELDYFPSFGQGWPSVTSLQPELAWAPFPNSSQQSLLQERTSSPATAVRYDLRIWETVANRKGDLVYERLALPAPTHQLEVSLKSHAEYLWSMRACFDLGPHAVCTPWAFALAPPPGPGVCETVNVPPRSYYRFRTP